MSIKLEGKDDIYRGSIGPFTSDNLGVHMLGGYPESFNSLRICRFCMATKQERNCKVNDHCFLGNQKVSL